MIKTTYTPIKYLAKYVDRIYVLKSTDKLPSLLPGTGLELLFHLGETVSINGKETEMPHIICSRNEVLSISNTESNFISVRFKCGAFRHFSSLPFSEINNQTLTIEEIWKDSFQELHSQLEETSLIETKINLIQSFLIEKLKENRRYNYKKWDSLINKLYYNHHKFKIAELTQNLSLSKRQFERNFKTEFGITPKQKQRIIRFEKTVKEILLNKKSNYLSTALDNGYYDQSHFINEFKEFSGKIPSEYFDNKIFSVHHYDEKLIYTTTI